MSGIIGSDNGVAGGVNVTATTTGVIAAFTAIGWVNAIEVIFRAFLTFKDRHSLYFWSVIISAAGAMVHGLAGVLKLFSLVKYPVVPAFLLYFGWWFMVTGQAVVLYSRLHLIVSRRRVLNFVKYMIATNFVVLCVVQTVFGIGSNLGNELFEDLFNIYERIQVTGFCLQEFIISGIYIYETNRLIKNDRILNTKGAVQILRHLIGVNIIVIVMDFAILGTEYADFFWVEVAMKPAIYTYKLRLEFSILNRLMDLVKSKGRPKTVDFRSTEEDTYYAREVTMKPKGIRSQGATYSVAVHTNDGTTTGANPVRTHNPQDSQQGVILATTDVEVKSTDAICLKDSSDNSLEMLPTVYYRDEIYAGPTGRIPLPHPGGHCSCCTYGTGGGIFIPEPAQDQSEIDRELDRL